LSEENLPVVDSIQRSSLITSGVLNEFRATIGHIEMDPENEGVSVPLMIAQSNNLHLGDAIYYSPLFPTKGQVERSRELLQGAFLTHLFDHRPLRNPVPTAKPIASRGQKMFLSKFSQWFKSVYQFSHFNR